MVINPYVYIYIANCGRIPGWPWPIRFFQLDQVASGGGGGKNNPFWTFPRLCYKSMEDKFWTKTKCKNMQKPYIWVDYDDLTTTSLEIMVSKGNHPQMALIQVSEIL